MDSAIYTRAFNSRALGPYRNNAAQKAFRIERDGTMWAAFYEDQANETGFSKVSKGTLFTSGDDGFTWNLFATFGGDVTDSVRYYGLPCFVFDDGFDFIWILTMAALAPNSVELNRIAKSDGTVTNYDYEGENFVAVTHQPFDNEYYNGMISACGNARKAIYTFWTNPNDKRLRGMHFDMSFAYPEPREIAGGQIAINTTGACDCVDASGKCHVVTIEEDDHSILSTVYTKGALVGTFTDFIDVAQMTVAANTPSDIGVDKDGWGTVGVAWSETNETGTSGDIKYALSLDDGGSFSVSGTLPAPVGTSGYQDNWANTAAAGSGTLHSTRILGSLDVGFHIAGIFEDQSTGQPQSYINELGTPDGATYTPSGWVKVATRDDQSITGHEYFRPMNEDFAFIGEKQDTHVAYLIGKGTNQYGTDSSRVSVFQERLTNRAYPNPISNDLLTQSNVDFHASGMIGTHTTKYEDVFTKNGVSGHIIKYIPVSEATVEGESAYSKSTESNTQIFFDSISYNRPATESTATNSQTAAVERDIRKIFIRPDFFMERVFITNDGGYLKRTIWMTEHLGNRYEITQIVPKFIDDQICFYEANAFVVGPSNNPFSRITLPSET